MKTRAGCVSFINDNDPREFYEIPVSSLYLYLKGSFTDMQGNIDSDVRSTRKALGMHRRQFAKCLGISKKTLIAWEKNPMVCKKRKLLAAALSGIYRQAQVAARYYNEYEEK